MTTITLPDHISFEELIKEWSECGENHVVDYCNYDKCYQFLIYQYVCEFKSVDGKIMARFYPDSRKLELQLELKLFEYDRYGKKIPDNKPDEFQPILDYIKERSHPYITLPDYISFEEIAAKWCEDNRNGIGFTTRKDVENYIVYEFICFCDEAVGEYKPADYYPSNRKIFIKNEEKFQPILDYIKERSNG